MAEKERNGKLYINWSLQLTETLYNNIKVRLQD